MQTPNDVLDASITASKTMLNLLCADLTPSDYLHRRRLPRLDRRLPHPH